MKRIILLAFLTLTAFFIISLAAISFLGIALAATPTVIDTDTGASLWTYADGHDDSAKNEGAYKGFDERSNGNGYYNVSPHGGYDSSSNKCKICHAVHRAEGAYYLLRADTQDDACDYCHVGGGAHSVMSVYNLNPAGTATTNGHTIGASAIIPDSSVKEWTEETTLTATDASGTVTNEVVQVRAYNPNRNQMFRFARHHGHNATNAEDSGYMRIGPLALTCMSCHQQHNAKNMIWKPTDISTGNTKLTNGYMLLRASPSASIEGTATIAGQLVDYDQGMLNYTAYEEFDPANGKFLVSENNIVKVPEDDMSAANTGPGHTIYTTFLGTSETTQQAGPTSDPQTVNQYTLSPWCADCHNLNIGYWKPVSFEELGFKSHSDKTHPSPFKGAYNGPGQCYSCHRNDMPNNPSQSWYDGSGANVACEECHFGTGSYIATKHDVGNGVASDFPHSGQSNSIKLLGPTTKQMNENGSFSYGSGVTESNIDGVCLRCHSGIGVNH